MKDRSILFLLGAILVVGLFIGAQEFIRSKNPRRLYQEIMVFDLYPQTLLSIHVSSTNGVIDCVRKNGVWTVGSAEQGMGRADPTLVYKLVSQLNTLGKGTTITARQLELRGLDPAEYGFDDPSLSITTIDMPRQTLF